MSGYQRTDSQAVAGSDRGVGGFAGGAQGFGDPAAYGTQAFPAGAQGSFPAGAQGYGAAFGSQEPSGQGYGQSAYGAPAFGAAQGSGGAAYGPGAFGGSGQGAGFAEPGYPGASHPGTGQDAAYGASGGYGVPGGNGAVGGHRASGGYDVTARFGAAGGYGTPGGYASSGGNGGSGEYGAPAGFGGSGGYGDQAGQAYQAYGQASAGFGDAGYGSMDRPANGYQGASYTQQGFGFGETSTTAQYGQLPSPQAPDLAGVEYAVSDWATAANDGTPGTPRPYGRLSIFTLLEDKMAEFDRLAEHAAEGVRAGEPDTLVYVIHVVPKAPMQRIIYEIYRDRAAFEAHERQSHIERFVAERKACVLATNIIDLRLKYAKVAALVTPSAPEPSPETQSAPPPTPPTAPTPPWPPRVPGTHRALEPATRAPSFSPHGSGQYSGPGLGEYAEVANGRRADGNGGKHAGTSYERPEHLERPERLAGSDGRSPWSPAQDWDQPSYQGGRYGGS